MRYPHDARADACRLYRESKRLSGDRESTLCQGDVNGGLRAEGPDRFTSGIPAAVEGIERCLPTCGVVRCPPVPELLVPALAVSGTDAHRSSPCRGVSMRVHHHLLLVCGHVLCCAVRS